MLRGGVVDGLPASGEPTGVMSLARKSGLNNAMPVPEGSRLDSGMTSARERAIRTDHPGGRHIPA